MRTQTFLWKLINKPLIWCVLFRTSAACICLYLLETLSGSKTGGDRSSAVVRVLATPSVISFIFSSFSSSALTCIKRCDITQGKPWFSRITWFCNLAHKIYCDTYPECMNFITSGQNILSNQFDIECVLKSSGKRDGNTARDKGGVVTFIIYH